MGQIGRKGRTYSLIHAVTCAMSLSGLLPLAGICTHVLRTSRLFDSSLWFSQSCVRKLCLGQDRCPFICFLIFSEPVYCYSLWIRGRARREIWRFLAFVVRHAQPTPFCIWRVWPGIKRNPRAPSVSPPDTFLVSRSFVDLCYYLVIINTPKNSHPATVGKSRFCFVLFASDLRKILLFVRRVCIS